MKFIELVYQGLRIHPGIHSIFQYFHLIGYENEKESENDAHKPGNLAEHHQGVDKDLGEQAGIVDMIQPKKQKNKHEYWPDDQANSKDNVVVVSDFVGFDIAIQIGDLLIHVINSVKPASDRPNPIGGKQQQYGNRYTHDPEN